MGLRYLHKDRKVDVIKLGELRMADLEHRFPNVNPKEGENLNIAFHIRRLIMIAWMDPKKYPTFKTVCKAVGYSERQFYRIKEGLQLPPRPAI